LWIDQQVRNQNFNTGHADGNTDAVTDMKKANAKLSEKE